MPGRAEHGCPAQEAVRLTCTRFPKLPLATRHSTHHCILSLPHLSAFLSQQLSHTSFASTNCLTSQSSLLAAPVARSTRLATCTMATTVPTAAHNASQNGQYSIMNKSSPEMHDLELGRISRFGPGDLGHQAPTIEKGGRGF